MEKKELTPEQISKLNIFQKMSLVTSEVKNISKDMTVGKGNFAYKAVSDNNVTQKINAAEQKFGLVSYAKEIELVESKEIDTTSGSGKEVMYYVEIVRLTLVIVNMDNKDETLEVKTYARGLDTGDKGFGKASTYARKYALLNAYKLPTGEDLDEQPSTQVKKNVKKEKSNFKEGGFEKALEAVSNGTKKINWVLDNYNCTPEQIKLLTESMPK